MILKGKGCVKRKEVGRKGADLDSCGNLCRACRWVWCVDADGVYSDAGNRRGYVSVFWTNIRVRLIAQVLSFLIVFILFMANNIVLRRISLKENGDLALISRVLPMVLVTFIIAFIASRFISDNVYSRFLAFANSTAFNRVDPVFSRILVIICLSAHLWCR